MSDKMRWRWGDTNPVMAAVDSSTVIEIGDLVYLDTDDAKPAGDQADGGTAAQNQQTLHTNFLGVAMQRSRSGDTTPIRVATTGVFEYDCASATFEIGDLIGAASTVGDDALYDQTVVAVSNAYEAIGRVARREPSASTSVLLAVQSTIMTGGIQAASAAP